MKGTEGELIFFIKIHTCATNKIYAVGINTGKIIYKNRKSTKMYIWMHKHILNIVNRQHRISEKENL